MAEFGVTEVTALAHQFTAQPRVRGETIAAMQPIQVINQQEAANWHRHGKLLFTALQGDRQVGQPVALVEVFGLNKLIDIAKLKMSVLVFTIGR